MSLPPPHYQVGGALQAGALYVERAADSELIEALSAGDFCYILGPRQIGKSSLRLRATAALRDQGVQCVNIDFSGLGSSSVTQDDWYFSIAFEIAEGLGLREPDTFWREHRHLSPVHRWYRWIRNELLALTTAPLVVFIDEVDSVLALTFTTDDFFASVRAAYNLRADDPDYQRLSFCLLGVAAPGDLIKNPVRTPFNIGRGIRLDDFSRAEMAAFGPGLSELGADTEALLDAVYAWSSGHPYMTQRLCNEVRRRGLESGFTESTLVDDVAYQLFIRSGRAGDPNLAYAEKRLDAHPSRARVRQMLHLYRLLLDGERVLAQPNNALQTELRLMGIATEVRHERETYLRTRNLIFAEVYDHAWLKQKTRAYRLAESVDRWKASAKHDDYVLRGHALQDALEWSRGRSDLTLDEHEYILSGVEFARQEAEQRSMAADALRRQEEARRALLEEQRRTEEARYRAELERERRERAEDSANSQRRLISMLSVVVLGLGAILVSFGTRFYKVGELQNEMQALKRQHHGEVLEMRDRLGAQDALLLAQEPSREVDALVLAVRAASSRDLTEYPRLMQALVAAVATPQPDPVLLHHPQRVRAASFSSDGSLVLTTSDDRIARLWDTATGESLQEFRGHWQRVRWAMFSPDGRHVVTASGDRTTRLWELHTGVQRAVFGGQPRGNQAAAFSPTLDRLLTISDAGPPQLWDPDTESRVATLQHGRSPVRAVALAPDGARVATAHADGELQLWDGRSGKLLLARPDPERTPLLTIAYSRKGERIVTLNERRVARLWEAEDLTPLEDLTGHRGAVTSARFSNTGQYVITLDDQGAAKLWTSDRGDHLKTFERFPDAPKPTGPAVDVAPVAPDKPPASKTAKLAPPDEDALAVAAVFSRDDASLATYGRDGIARLWRIPTGEPLSSLRRHRGPILWASFDPGGQRLVTAGADGTARLWNALNGLEVATLEGHEGPVRSAIFSPDGRRLATVGDDRDARLWSTAVVNPLPALKGHMGALRAAHFSPDGTRIVTAGEDRSARLWDASEYRLVRTLRDHDGPVAAIVFPGPEDPQDRFLTLADGDPDLRVWSSKSGELVATITVLESPVRAAAFSPGGRELLTTRKDGLTDRWSVATGERAGDRPSCRSRAAPVHVAIYGRDGRHLLTAGHEPGTVELIDTLTCDARPLTEVGGASGVAVVQAAFSRASDKLVLITADHRAHLWRVPDGAFARSFTIEGDSVLTATFSPDGSRLLLTGRSGGGEFRTTPPYEQINELPTQPGPIMAAAYGRDGRLLVTAGGDADARLWKAGVPPFPLPFSAALSEVSEARSGLAQSFTQLATLRGHQATITSVAFSPDGRSIVTAGRDGVARVFPSDPETYLEHACLLLRAYSAAYQEVEGFCRAR